MGLQVGRTDRGDRARRAEAEPGESPGHWNYVLRTEKRMSYGVGGEVVSERDAFALSTRVRPECVLPGRGW